MPSLIQGFEYDIFISYRHNDNRSGWVTEFVEALQEELAATIKEPLSIYFDKNPHNGLLETHNVDKSLEGKLKCLIFIPIISQTYCDPKSFAWQHEFVAFNKLAQEDSLGRDVVLNNGNVASRILPVKIHELDPDDTVTIEEEIGGVLRAIEFIHKSAGVNRPLTSLDDQVRESGKVLYRDQVNKVANAIKEILVSLQYPSPKQTQQSFSELKNSSTLNKKLRIAILSFIVLLIAAYFIYPKIVSSGSGQEIEKSIAVLPFRDMSQDADQQYFADGVMEDILTQLQKIGELKVISRTSVEQYRNTNKPAPQIGDELNVGFLLEGSVRKAENLLMITVQLINTNNDSHVWANNFESEYSAKGLFEIQRQIAETIVQELKIQISPEAIDEITKPRTDNMQAYDLYQRGILNYNQFNEESNKLAVNMFKQAIRLDPSYTDAYALLANAYTQRVGNFLGAAVWLDTAAYYAEKGIALDSNCSECYSALAKVEHNKGKIQKSIDYDLKAIAIDSLNGRSVFNLLNKSLRYGKFELAIENTQRLSQINIKSLPNPDGFVTYNLAWLFHNLGESDKARAYASKIKSLDHLYSFFPVNTDRLAHTWLYMQDSLGFNNSMKVTLEKNPLEQRTHYRTIGNFWLQKNYRGLVDYYQGNKIDLAIPNTDFQIPHMISFAYWQINMPDRAATIIQESLDLASLKLTIQKDKFWATGMALRAMYLSKEQESLGYLEKAIELGYLLDLSKDNRFAQLRNNPRFTELVEKQKKKRQEVMTLVATYNFPKPEDL